MNIEYCTGFYNMKRMKKDPFQTDECRVQKRTSFGTAKVSVLFKIVKISMNGPPLQNDEIIIRVIVIRSVKSTMTFFDAVPSI